MQDKLSFLRLQIEVYKNQWWLLQIEHYQLELEIVAREKERILQEGDLSHFSFFISSLEFIIMNTSVFSRDSKYDS